MSVERIIFYVLLADSVAVNLIAWSKGRAWYRRNFGLLARALPMKRAWTTWYLVLVLLIGWIVFRNDL